MYITLHRAGTTQKMVNVVYSLLYGIKLAFFMILSCLFSPSFHFLPSKKSPECCSVCTGYFFPSNWLQRDSRLCLWGSHLYTMNFGWLTHTEFFWKYYLYLQRIEFTASSLISKSKWRPFLILDSHISPPGLQFCSFHLVCITSRHQWKKHACEKEKLNMVISYICKSWL